MPRDNATMTTLVVTKLQSAGTIDYTVADVDYVMQECLKDLIELRPHIVPVIFQLESRTGSDVTGTASSLTDTVKAQFLTTDPTNEKVVHNTTDNTWAVILTRTSASIVTLSADIMDANESYEIFNKRCTNKRQIYIGDIVDYPNIDSVEYPLGTRRNWKLIGDILEIDKDFIPDSNTNVDNLPNVDVLVNFARPPVLSSLTDWDGAVASTTGVAAGATSMLVSGLQATGTINVGEEFYLENQRSLYVVSASAAIASSSATVTFFPGLEAAAASTEVVTFRKSSLSPRDEDVYANLVAGKIMKNKANKYPNAISVGGGNAWSNYLTLGEKMVQDALRQLRASVPPKTRKRYTTE